MSHPETFYIFVNDAFFVTSHNLRITKHFVSAGFGTAVEDSKFLKKYLDGSATYAQFVPAMPDCLTISAYSMSSTSSNTAEYDAEYYRISEFPKLPSRLAAVYAFGSREDCQECSRKYGWEVGSIRDFELIDHPLNRVSRVNMEVVSLARYAYRNSMLDRTEREMIWRHYWNGGGNISMSLPASNGGRKVVDSGEIWEYLIEGNLRLKDTDQGVDPNA